MLTVKSLLFISAKKHPDRRCSGHQRQLSDLPEQIIQRHSVRGVCNCNEEAVSLDPNAALLNNKARSNRQGSEAITGVT